MGKKGWIALHRSMQDNVLWNEKPFSKGQAWIDMLLSANHSQNDVMLGNEIITLERGQFHTSELKLAERWGWSRNKVRAYLTLLEKLKMSTAKGTTKGTTITIENYGLYQDFEPTEQPIEPPPEGQRKDNERTTKGTQTTMYNNGEPLNHGKQKHVALTLNDGCKKNREEQVLDNFEKLWMLYPRKKNKASVTKKAKDNAYKIGYDEFARAIQRYATEVVGTEEKYIKTGSTFFNSAYQDYLDVNYQKEIATEKQEDCWQ